MIECLIFDCDGTLVDSERIANGALIGLFAEIGVSLDPEDFHQRFLGVNLQETVSDVEKTHRVKTSEDFIPEYRRRLAVVLENDLQAIPGVRETLPALSHPMCVATSAPQEKVQLCLRVAGLRGFFGDRLFSSYDIRSWKPEPDLFLHAAATMGFAPEQCAVIEDSPVGIAAGLAAGMTTIHFNHDGKSDTVAGTIQIDRMADLPSVLG